MHLVIEFWNPGGIIASVTVTSEVAAAKAVAKMVTDAGELYDGDRIVIRQLN